jgi:hypothetical protein
MRWRRRATRIGRADAPAPRIELVDNAVKEKVRHKWRSTESYDEEDGSVVDW